MGMSIYAATIETSARYPQGCVDSVFDIEEAWSLGYANARLLFGKLGFDAQEDHLLLPIDEVQAATLRALNGPTANYTEETRVSRGARGATMVSFGADEGMLRTLLQRLATIVRDGRAAGATHIAAA